MPPKKQRGRPPKRKQPGFVTLDLPVQPPPRSISRRSSRPDIELMMECDEEDLSPAQVAAMRVAREEHEKANNLIKEARAGSTLVPSSQPNTFTIVPSKPVQAPPPLLKAPPPHMQANKPAANQVVDLTHQAIIPQRPIVNPSSQFSQPFSDVQMLDTGPPPRAQQFLDKHSQKKDDMPDIMIIGESPPRPSSKVVVNQSVVNPKMSMPVSSATPTQVYKFVNHGGTAPQPSGNNQWLMRPVLTVTPQQNQIEKMRHKQQLELRLEQQRQELKHQQIMAAGLQLTKQINQISASSPLGYTINMPGEESARKKARKESGGEIDQSGHWVPLDEYYYGTLDGDAAYAEEKGEFRFKCWYCSKMLYNNVRAMQHIQGHIDSSKQQNIDLSDLTQCKHCYIQFDTPFQMQTHAEKVHLGNKVLTCRICEKAFGTTKELILHMRQHHLPCEMPYGCQLCGFKSSMYSDVVDHFKKKHDSSQSMLCLYCLRVFKIKFTNQGWGQTQTYYGHLLKHQVKSSMKKCNTCRLMFFNPLDVKGHKKSCHVGHCDNMKDLSGLKSRGDDQLMIKVSSLDRKSGAASNRSSSGSIRGSGPSHKGGSESNKGNYSQLKSLNAPSITKIQDYGDVSLPRETTKSFCIECKMTMSSADHYKKYINCSLCRFATSCSVAYAQHMLGYHSGQVSSLNLKIPWERPMKQVMYCVCGFSSKYGTKMANHLVSCGKQTCSELKPSAGAVSMLMESQKDDSKRAGGIFGALGLVQKKPMTTRVRLPDSERGELKSETNSETNAALKTKETPMKKPTEAGDTEVEILVPGVKEKFTGKVVIPVKKCTDDKAKAEKPEPIEVDDDTDDIKTGDAKEIKEDDNTIVIDVDKMKDEENPKVEDRGDQGKEDIKAEETVTDLDTEIDDSKDMSGENASKDNTTDMPDDDNEAIGKVEEMDDKNVTNKESHDVEKSTDITDESMECEESNTKGLITDNEEGKPFDADLEKQTDVVQLAKTGDIDDQVDNNKSETDEMSNTSFITLDNTLESDVSETPKGKEEKVEPRDDADTQRSADEMEGIETDPTDEQIGGSASEPDISMKDSKTLDTGEDENDKSQQNTADTESLKDDNNTDGCSKQVLDNPDDTGADKPDSSGDTPNSSGDKVDDSKLDEPTPTIDSVSPTGDTADETKDTEDVTAKEEDQTKVSGQRPEEERVRHKSGDSQRSDTSSRSSQGRQEYRSHGGHHHGDRSQDRYQRDDRHGANRSDDYHGNQSSYDRNRDRDRSHDRDHHRGNNRHDNRYGSDHRGGYGQGHNRGQGYRGQGGNRGQYGGYHQGNRGRGGGYHQDWNYNRNQGNQGGYRGGYRGGYY